MTEIKLKNRKPNTEKLSAFGFEKADSYFAYYTDLADGQMELTVTVNCDGTVGTTVIDRSSGEEYVLHLVESASGAFVGQVKAEYEEILEKISDECFDREIFKSEQAKAVIAYVQRTYGDELEYLWQKFPDNAVVRRKDCQKWYAAILTVVRRKLGFESDEKVEVLDLRMKPEDIEQKADGIKILPGYHMNKKHWITICLDGSVSLDEIYQKIDESYILAKK